MLNLLNTWKCCEIPPRPSRCRIRAVLRHLKMEKYFFKVLIVGLDDFFFFFFKSLMFWSN